ncbi:MAG: hypothetical protein HY343_02720 [Lentisphaerae bacterium]|nr:hypothetical protein [Lentisphaerota bacterium]
MYQDEIISEVWRNREALAKRHNHDLHAIVVEMQRRQQTPLSKLADRRRQTNGRLAIRSPER